ncbi:MAG: hypothetical protein ACBZ72_06490 [Candidatus Bathyarchaeia archaeon]|jgi:hypothetical protein
MKLQKQKTVIAANFLILMLIATTLLVYVPSTQAQQELPTYAFLAVSPNPVGINQEVLVTMWLNVVPLTAGGAGGDRWQDMTCTITKPDGSNETMGPFTSDPVGLQYFLYTPDQLGSYFFQWSFPGQHITGTDRFGNPVDATYSGSTSPEVELVVQQEAIEPYPDWPLPEDYWERPIDAENRDWWTISGNWYSTSGSSRIGVGDYDCKGRFNPYTTAPNTAHILWTREIYFGGLIGGEFLTNQYNEGQTYEPKFGPPVIIQGRLYYNDANSPRYGFYCVDLRTGEELWYENDTSVDSMHQNIFNVRWYNAITMGQVYSYESPNQHGGFAYLWEMTGPPQNMYYMYDAFSGELILSMTNASTGTSVFTPNGDLLIYMLDGTNNWLAMWNSSKAIPPAGPNSTDAWQWRPDNQQVLDWNDGIEWNVTTPDVPGVQALAKIDSYDGTILATTGSTFLPTPSQIEVGYNASTGEEMFRQNRTLIPGATAYGVQGPMAEGVYTEFIKEELTWYGYNSTTGEQLWGPTESYNNSWGMYSGGQSGGTHNIAYGKLYATAYDGMVHCYDLYTGDHLWDYSSGNSGLETPYGTYPFSSVGFSVADEKLYVCTGEHSPTKPMWRGEKLHCVNAETGEGIWSILGWFQAPVIADGYLVSLNGADNRLYCFGKGKTETTVSVSTAQAAVNEGIGITGTVMDMSPAQAGTPAIADEYMTEWMEYQNMQKPCPMDAAGVPVKLQATRSDGSITDIGTTTSDANGVFRYAWVPPEQDIYEIVATFEGSDSYWRSFGTTTVTVGAGAGAEATASASPTSASPTASATHAPSPGADATSWIYIAAAVIVVVIVIVIAAVMLRRR